MYNFQNTLLNINQFRYGTDQDGFAQSEDPTYLTFSLDFNMDVGSMFEDATGLNRNPLLSNSLDDESANTEIFLRKRKLEPQAARLAEFKKRLLDISTKMPWYFQTIKGLGALWQNASNMQEPQKAKEIELEIGTLESIDLKVSYLAELYRKSMYDGVYMREIVPDNLRWFALDLYVAEFRHIYNFESVSPDATVTDVISANSSYFANNSTFLKFELHQCEFDFSGSIPGAGEYSIYDGLDTPAENTFKVKVGWFYDKHQFSFYDIITKEGIAQHTSNYQHNKPASQKNSSTQDTLG